MQFQNTLPSLISSSSLSFNSPNKTLKSTPHLSPICQPMPKMPISSPHSIKIQLAQSHESSQIFTTEQQMMRFSRFQAWHLPQMVNNLQTQRNQVPVFLYKQNVDDDNSLLCTPYQNTSYGIFDHKNLVNTQKSTIDQNTNKNVVENVQSLSKNKNKQKGLRKLANRSYQIVKQMGQSNYKQVAMRLIKEMQEDQSEIDDEKQENNIKRRVYDALNVLIAMGVLRKRGKSIVYEPQICKSITSQNVKQSQKSKKKIDDKFGQNKKKKQIIKNLQNKLKAGKALVLRNSFKGQNNSEGQKIQFPFVCLFVSTNCEVGYEYIQSSIEEMNGTKNFVMNTAGPYQFFRDIELASKIFQ